MFWKKKPSPTLTHTIITMKKCVACKSVYEVEPGLRESMCRSCNNYITFLGECARIDRREAYFKEHPPA